MRQVEVEVRQRLPEGRLRLAEAGRNFSREATIRRHKAIAATAQA